MTARNKTNSGLRCDIVSFQVTETNVTYFRKNPQSTRLLTRGPMAIINAYFHKSSSWLYHKMDGIDGNGGKGGFSEKEAFLLRSALIDLSERLRKAADEII